MTVKDSATPTPAQQTYTLSSTVVQPTPTVTAISPNTSVRGTAVQVTLTGSNFISGATINAPVGITVSNVTVVSSTQITATFTIAGNAPLGASNVSVTTSGGISFDTVSFTITSPSPTLISITPTSGQQGSTVPVTLTGTNFVTPCTVRSYNSGITPSGCTVISSTQITATFAIAGNAPPDYSAVTITTPGGTSAVSFYFTVNPPPPTLTSIRPTSGAQGATVPVTLTGTNFVSPCTVLGSITPSACQVINVPTGITVSGLSVVSSTQITATFIIATNATSGSVSVTTSGGPSNAWPFTVNPAVTLTCAPSTGPTQVGVTYSASCTASGGTAPYSWSINPGTLPAGLTLNPSTGAIGGTPTVAGTANFTIRVTDSSSPQQSATQAFTITINPGLTVSTTFLPSGTAGMPYSALVVVQQGTPPYTWSVAGGALPAGLNLNATKGAITGTPSATGTTSFTIRVADSSAPAQSATRSFAITINPGLTFTQTSLPNGTVGLPYSASLSAQPGIPPYTWSVSAGALPAGLTLNASFGVITGTPTAAGPASFTIRVTDNSSPAQSASQVLAITINAALTITTTSLSNGTVGVSYTATVAALQGTPPYSWTVTAGVLPAGLNLNVSTGSIAGTPTATGTASFSVKVTDSGSPSQNATRAFTISVNPGLTITTTSLRNGTVGIPYSGTVSAQQGTPPYTWALSTGALPAGLNLNSPSGAISGTPTATGATSFTVKVTDSSSPPQSTTQALTIAVNQGASITTTSLANGIVGAPYTATLSAQQGTPPYTWVLAGGSLPAGLGLNASTGAISGTPTLAGTASFTVKVTDSSSPAQTATQALTVTINSGLTITTTSLPNGTVGVTYAATLTALQGSQPHTWSVSAGALPAGLTLNPTTGAIRGTPSVAGTTSLTIRVTDNSSPPQTATQAVTITINPALTITTASLPNGTVAAAYSATLNAQQGTPPYTWSVSAGALPAGLNVNPTTAAISGTPTTAGTFSFTIKVTDSSNPPQSATAPLTVAIRMVLPPITLTEFEATPVPTQPANAGLRLDAPAPVALQCELSLSFSANAAGVADGWADPALQFATGGTKVACTIPAGATTATLPQNGAIQQGTVAGDITVTLTRLIAGTTDVLPQTPIAKTLTIRKLAPVITAGSVGLVNMSATGFTVELVAYSTPRELASATLTFSEATGAQIQGSKSFTVPLSDPLTQWYGSDAGRSSGSAFTLRVPFTLSGDPNALQSVTATLTNSVGTSVPETGGRQ